MKLMGNQTKAPYSLVKGSSKVEGLRPTLPSISSSIPPSPTRFSLTIKTKYFDFEAQPSAHAKVLRLEPTTSSGISRTTKI